MRDDVVTAWAESATGPGWANRIVWVLRRDAHGVLWIDSVQPDEQGVLLQALHGAAASMARTVTDEARRVLRERKET